MNLNDKSELEIKVLLHLQNKTDLQILHQQNEDRCSRTDEILRDTSVDLGLDEFSLHLAGVVVVVEGLNGGWGSTCRMSVKISLLCRFSAKIFDL